MHSTAPPLVQHSLAELATTRAGASRVFLRHGLDFCCGGHTTLAEACATAGLDADDLAREILAEQAPESVSDLERWDRRPLAELVEHLLQEFHARHREELPALQELARKVERVHADKATCPRGLADHLAVMADELENHMQKEEQVLFPLIVSGNGHLATMPVQVLEQEHRDHGQNLTRLRELAGDYIPPSEACTTWRALLLRLAQLEADVMQHIHLENNVLFPRALRSQNHGQ